MLAIGLALVSLAVTAYATRVTVRAVRQARIAQAHAADALQRARTEEAERERVLDLLTETQTAWTEENARQDARVARLTEIQRTYDATIAEYQALVRMYRTALGERPDDPPTTH